jgi:adenine-specific DNA-methyltransferase
MFSYEYLLGLLNSSIYEFYIKSMAKKLGDDLYDYYPNKIMTLRIPEPIPAIEEEIKRGGKNLHYVIDMILSEELGISMEEYSVIRSWCS